MKMPTAIICMFLLTALATAARAEDKPAAAAKPTAAAKPAAPDAKPAEAKPAAPEVVMPWEKACDADMKKLCKDFKDDVRMCLAEHEKELSKDCTKHFSAAGYRVAKLCEADFAKFCSDAAAKGNLGQCVNANQAKLSPKCRNALLAGSQKEKEKAEKAAAKAAAKKEKTAEKAAKKEK